MIKRKISIRVSPDRLAAYQQAADRSGVSRHKWALAMLDIAAGKAGRSGDYAVMKLDQDEEFEFVRKNRTLTLEVSKDSVIDNYLRAASRARMSVSEWAVVVLDTASGGSELYSQLTRLYGEK